MIATTQNLDPADCNSRQRLPRHVCRLPVLPHSPGAQPRHLLRPALDQAYPRLDIEKQPGKHSADPRKTIGASGKKYITSAVREKRCFYHR